MAPLALALADRAARADVGKDVKVLAVETRAKHAKAAGRVEVTCAEGLACTPKIDGKPPPEGGWVGVGDHDVSWTCGDAARSATVSVTGGGEAKLDASCPEPEPTPAVVPPVPTLEPRVASKPAPRPRPSPQPALRASDTSGLSPTWVWVGVGVTAVLGAATVWSGVDTQSKHDDFVSDGRRNTALRDDGMSAQTRTNILGAGTGVAALATLGLALFAVDFRSQRELGLSTKPAPTGASFRGRF